MLFGLADIGILTLFVSNSVVKLILNERIR